MEGVSKSPRFRPLRGMRAGGEASASGTAQPVAGLLPQTACAAWGVRLRKSAGFAAPRGHRLGGPGCVAPRRRPPPGRCLPRAAVCARAAPQGEATKSSRFRPLRGTAAQPRGPSLRHRAACSWDFALRRLCGLGGAASNKSGLDRPRSHRRGGPGCVAPRRRAPLGRCLPRAAVCARAAPQGEATKSSRFRPLRGTAAQRAGPSLRHRTACSCAFTSGRPCGLGRAASKKRGLSRPRGHRRGGPVPAARGVSSRIRPRGHRPDGSSSPGTTARAPRRTPPTSLRDGRCVSVATQTGLW